MIGCLNKEIILSLISLPGPIPVVGQVGILEIGLHVPKVVNCSTRSFSKRLCSLKIYSSDQKGLGTTNYFVKQG
jgi:hypothetical protein